MHAEAAQIKNFIHADCRADGSRYLDMLNRHWETVFAGGG